MSQRQSQQLVNVVPLQPVRQTYTYSVPDDLRSAAAPGTRALIPFGRKLITGVIASIASTQPEKTIKPLWDVLDREPLWTKAFMDFTAWAADYYFAPWGEVLRAALPQGMTAESDFRVVPLVENLSAHAARLANTRAVKRAALLRLVAENPRGISVKTLRRKLQFGGISGAIKEFETQGLVAIEATEAEQKAKPKRVRVLRLPDALAADADALREAFSALEARSPKQAAILTLLYDRYRKNRGGAAAAEIVKRTGASSSALVRLIERQFAVEYEQEVARQFLPDSPPQPQPDFQLNASQSTAVAAIRAALDAHEYQTFLLHGVTGSGKTQVYIEAIKDTLARNRSVITLVPEISLTPQLIDRYRAYFGDQIAVQHSKMSIGERYDMWRAVQSGKRNVVIGARSAVFAPVRNLGLIVVDEEHETAFKQIDAMPRYNARDCAVVRAQTEKAAAVLGSATPSLESYYNAGSGKYTLLELPNRVDNALMPDIVVIDMREARKNKTEHHNVSSTLRDHIQRRLLAGEGVILLQNRRGFAPVQQCMDCGESPQCPHCSVTLTFHKVKNQLRCHYCGFTSPAVQACTACGSMNVKLFGAGTQRVEEDIAAIFPTARIARMDLDSTARKGAHRQILDSFAAGETDILLGTQMVAKGLDFPRVTLAGVISADTQLHLPDFRASERTFQLLTQVAGRAGRSQAHKGEVVIQTFNPADDAIQMSVAQEYRGYYAHELQRRKEVFYPPFSRLILIEIRGKDETLVARHAQNICKLIPLADFYEILGPQPAPIPKMRDEYRQRIIVKADKQRDPGGASVRAALRNTLDEYAARHATRAVKIVVDVDPYGV